MKSILIKNATLVDQGNTFSSDILIEDRFISQIGHALESANALELNGEGLYVLPGVIDDQVHFREPGLMNKADIFTESRAAVAGGITSYMEMPNTIPQTLSQELLEQKYQIAAGKSLANYSFYMGTSNDNHDEVLKTDPEKVCGIKIFMGSSTGNMLVDDQKSLEKIFSESPMLIATHCEDETIIRKNADNARKKYGESVPIHLHPEIRSTEACYASSSRAVLLARKFNTRLHVLHISTARELDLFESGIPVEEKTITAEACIHHLWFTSNDYEEKGSQIKWNPAVKKPADREALRKAVISGLIDVIATDHAPHTLQEKQNTYFNAPSGGPLVQHALPAMLEMVHEGIFTLEQVVQKMAHDPARLFRIDRRGYIREGYYADLVMVDMDSPWKVEKDNILYKCGWSPFEGRQFRSKVIHTMVSGHLIYRDGEFISGENGMRLSFKR